MSNETLEEAAEKYTNTFINDDGTTEEDFKAGAKWQAERMYSEEEVLNLLNTFGNRNGSVEGEKLTKQWFEQFKKK